MPLAQCQLIREMKTLLLSGELDPKTQEVFMSYIDSCLNATSKDMVIIEAATAVCDLASQFPAYLENAYSLLQAMIGSTKSIVKYSALKLIKRIASLNLSLAAQSVVELEALVTHANKSVASMAISINLKICKEKEVDPLLATIYQYLPETGDDFRVDTIRSLKQLVKRYPSTARVLIDFLKKCLRLYSNADFKKEIIESVLYIIQTVPQSREEALSVIADLIEDCQYDALISRVSSPHNHR